MGPPRSKRSRPPDSVIPEDESSSLIACETCRQRKCKCDRKLPYCSQCAGEPSKCVYPESGKRGLPLGYLNQLEQRLVATEAALYGALATLQSVRPTAVVQAWPNPESVHKPKSARMDEWSQLPLRGWSDMDRWQTAVSDQFVVGHAQGLSVDTPRSAYTIPVTPSQNDAPTPSVVAGQGSSDGYAWQSRSEIPIRFSYGAHAPAPMDGSSPSGYSRDRVTAVSDGVASPGGYPQNHRVTPGDSGASQFAETRQSSRAEALSQSNPGIYF